MAYLDLLLGETRVLTRSESSVCRRNKWSTGRTQLAVFPRCPPLTYGYPESLKTRTIQSPALLPGFAAWPDRDPDEAKAVSV